MLRRIPLALGALVLAAGAALLMVNLAVLAMGHSAMKLVPGLTGVTESEPLAWGVDDVLDGRFQAGYAHLVGTQMPLYPAAVRLRNQVEFSLLGFSPNPVILVTTGGTLLERAYADEYCSRNIARWRPGALAWAARIRQMQDAEEARGKTFLYVLTPSKVAQYPALLPSGFNCPSRPADRVGLLPAWLSMLREAGVHVADTTAVVSAAHGAYPFPLYPAGGTHWNAVGAALAQQAVLGRLDQEMPGRGFAPFQFTWRMASHPVRDSDDVDLARLLNLFFPAANGPVPIVTMQPPPAQGPCRPPRVTIVGGSFSHATLKALGALSCPIPAIEYEYWHTATLRWGHGELLRQGGVDASQRDANVLSADVLIYEENEQLLRDPLHGQALWDFLQRTPHPP